MRTTKKPFRAHLHTKLALCFLIILLSACAQEENDHEHDNSLSGTWEYHSVYVDQTTNQFIDTHVHVKLTDDGNHIALDHCLHDKGMSFTRNENTLTNDNGQSLEILHADKISSVSVPALSHLVKIDKTHDLLNAGSLTLQSEELPEIALTNNVCAQRTYIENDNGIMLHLSIPFMETYLDMTLDISDVNKTPNNLVSGTFYSPNFLSIYGLNDVQALSGNINFLELTDSKARFDFDIDIQGRYSNFVIDTFTGSADVTL